MSQRTNRFYAPWDYAVREGACWTDNSANIITIVGVKRPPIDEDEWVDQTSSYEIVYHLLGESEIHTMDALNFQHCCSYCY